MKMVHGLTVASSLLVTAIGWHAYAASVTGTATATIVRSSFSVECKPLSFGNIKQVDGPGFIIVTPGGQRFTKGRIQTGNYPHFPSSCAVMGPANTSYTVRAPRFLYFTASGEEAGDTQRLDTLKVSNIRIHSKNLRKKGISLYQGISDESGRDELSVGATLYVSSNAAPGIYEGVIPITIHY